MTTALLISFRETLEASLLVGLVVTLLHREGGGKPLLFAWWGVACGIIVSILGSVLLGTVAKSLPHEFEAVYEGLLMLAASGMVAWVVLWIGAQAKNIRHSVEVNVRSHLLGENMAGIFFLCFIATAREGLEMAIFLRATVTHFIDTPLPSLGVLLGVLLAISITVGIARGLRGIPIRRLFVISGVILLVVGFGLAVRGVGELHEAELFGSLSGIVWDTSAILRSDSSLGHFATTFFGYVDRPTILQVITGILYLVVVWLLLLRVRKLTIDRRSV